MERLMNQSLTVKISVFIYLIVIILFLFLSLFLFGIVGRASEQRLSEAALQIAEGCDSYD